MNKIYIYETPDSKKQGLIKIGETSGSVEDRIAQQLNTASTFDALSLKYSLLFQTEAVYANGKEFSDKDIHSILKSKGYSNHKVSDEGDDLKTQTEWFKIDVDKVIHLIECVKKGMKAEEIDIDRFQDFPMRPEQQQAVEQTLEYFRTNQSTATVEMLWNAKMRFGKTFAAYQLAKKGGYSKVIVLTYKPAVEDAWQKDLENHVDFADYVFLRRDSLSQINDYLTNKGKRVVAFASYQDLLGGKDEDNDIKDRHRELFATDWDLVIIDEFHYGAGTQKAREMISDEAQNKAEAKKLEAEYIAEEDDEELEEQHTQELVQAVEKSIKSKYRLYLSGTPFKAIADSKFERDAIFNWTYTDEQRAKAQWALDNPGKEDKNPYRTLPQIKMYLYKVTGEVLDAAEIADKNEFSLNYFFRTEKKKFVKEDAVLKWLDLICGKNRGSVSIDDQIDDNHKVEPSQFPFDDKGQLFEELDHTLWYLNRVDSAIALKELLKRHAVFRSYTIILAAGKEFKSGVDAVQPVLDAIDANKRTITISVGKLTTGVSVPKWKAVLFLRDTASPENYFQTAFRAQTPYQDRSTGYIKKTCYIFDFSPNRSLRLLTSYSEKLTNDGRLVTSEEKIGEFIRYLPVLKVSGSDMVSMDAREVLTFDLSGIDAKGLGERFIDRKNIVVTRETIDAISQTEESSRRCQEIFDKIKLFRKYTGVPEAELTASDVKVADLDANNKRIKDLKTKETSSDREKEKVDKDVAQAEKELKSEREKVRELLKTLLSRIPVFMYLTDATEENLEQVLVETKHDLFRKATGITLDDFAYLRDVGLIRIDSIDGYILKFVQLESGNFAEINNS